MRALAAAAALALLFCGAIAARADRAAVPDAARLTALFHGSAPVTWVFTGDSITQGAEHTNGWRDYTQHFAERVRWEMRRYHDVVINTAISGNTSTDVLREFDSRVARFNPTVVFVMVGTNDAVRGKAGEAPYRSNLLALVARIRKIGAIPVLETPTPVEASAVSRSDLPRYVAIMQDVAQTQNVVLVDYYADWMKAGNGAPPPEWMNNSVHPNQRGHLEMAKMLFRALGIFDPNSPICRLVIP